MEIARLSPQPKAIRQSDGETRKPSVVTEIPYDTDSERALLGICLTSGVEAAEEILFSAQTAGLFHDLRHAEIWNRIEKLVREQKPIEAAFVNKVRIEHEVELSYLAELANDGLPIGFVKTYLPLAVEQQRRRAALNVAQSLAIRAGDKTVKIDEAIDEAEQSLFSSRYRAESEGTTRQAINAAISEWEAAAANPGKYTGIESGFHDLDEMTWGFQDKNLIVIAARPSQGKTAALLNIADHAAIERQIPTLMFSLESSRGEIVKRIICARASANGMELRAGNPAATNPALTTAIAKLNKSPLFIDDRSMGISQMRSVARRYVKKHKVKLILVDYLQKVKPSRRQEKRTYEVGEVSEGLKEIAKELNVPVIAAAQLNRESEKEKGRRPKPSDLGDSGMIERDADVIACLYRLPDQQSREQLQYELLISKHRDGPCGTVNLRYLPEFTRFEGI